MMRRAVLEHGVRVNGAARHAAQVNDAYRRLADHLRNNPMPQSSLRARVLPSFEEAEQNAELRLQREDVSETDPLGGMYHKDYYRDPASGFTPKYSPRNFAEGGRLEHYHPLGDTQFYMSEAERNAGDHNLLKLRQDANRMRQSLRELAPGPGADRLRDTASERNWRGKLASQGGVGFQAVFDKLGVQDSLAAHTGDWTRTVPSAHSLPAGVTASVLHRTLKQQNDALETKQDSELLNSCVHGIRHKERAEHEIGHRFSFTQFRGYDLDKAISQRSGQLFGQLQLAPLVSPSSVDEAQQNVRRGAVPTDRAVIATAMNRNTVSVEPHVGEPLTESLISARNAAARLDANQKKEAREKELGLGRQGPLVSEGGPDQREIRPQKNDERLLNAARFLHGAYRDSPRDLDYIPYQRSQTASGVSHLLTNRFDVDRRIDRITRGLPDVTERFQIFLGEPIRQQIDTAVCTMRNASNERAMDYYQPGPSNDDMQLLTVHRDVEGFALFRQKVDLYEWELFVRYRAHHEQRRTIALQHGLEPTVNEGVEERDARRHKLDVLCEQTPFDSSHLSHSIGELNVQANILRQWFGAYTLPTPTICNKVMGPDAMVGLHVAEGTLEAGVADNREHVLSARYFNRLLTNDAYVNRLGRSFARDVVNRAPEPLVPHAHSNAVLAHFTEQERALYSEYVKDVTDAQIEAWRLSLEKVRWVPSEKQNAVLVDCLAQVDVVDMISVGSGSRITVGYQTYSKSIEAQKEDVVLVDGEACMVDMKSRRRTTVVRARLDDGSVISMEEKEWFKNPVAHASPDPNAHLNYGLGQCYSYNRCNYIETQDVIWETRTYGGEEGWSPALVSDGLREGTPVQAQRVVSSDGRLGGFERAEVIVLHTKPHTGPEGTATVRFRVDGCVQTVPVSSLRVWQVTWYGPNRTLPEHTRRSTVGSKRVVDFRDPTNSMKLTEPHFLDKYTSGSGASPRDAFRSVKLVSDIDKWNMLDRARAENHRLLSITHRKDFIRLHYFYKYTPWEYIAHQEANQPIIKEQITEDSIGPSYYFSPNRFWRYKRRPYGYLDNFPNEIRDFLGHVDHVTPWNKAKQIRTFWESREHHPMPYWNRPGVALHRNTAALLPTNLWTADKRTGKVKALKDSVAEYHPMAVHPSWASL